MSQSPEVLESSRAPLGLPQGSVRALLTLFTMAVVLHEMILGRKVDVLWNETLLIALAHYFSRRRYMNIPAEAIPRLQQEGILPAETKPLYLPTGFIRGLIVLAFGATGVYLYREGRLFNPEVLPILGAVGAYVLGIVFGKTAQWIWQPGKSRFMTKFQDMQAMVVLIAVAATAAIYFIHGPAGLPDWLKHSALFLSLYYFGAR